jgi:endogenous inhibitor of DNA gyrase (YacG/DUF329 family)
MTQAPPAERTCEQCGRTYVPKDPRSYWQRYCSDRCKQKAYRLRKEKEKTQVK